MEGSDTIMEDFDSTKESSDSTIKGPGSTKKDSNSTKKGRDIKLKGLDSTFNISKQGETSETGSAATIQFGGMRVFSDNTNVDARTIALIASVTELLVSLNIDILDDNRTLDVLNHFRLLNEAMTPLRWADESENPHPQPHYLYLGRWVTPIHAPPLYDQAACEAYDEELRRLRDLDYLRGTVLDHKSG